MVLVQAFRVELEQEMMHVLKKVFKLKIVMVPAMPVVVHVNHGQNGVHAMLHVVPELKVEVVLVALIKDVQMPIKRGHVMLVLHVRRLVVFVVRGVHGVVVVLVVDHNPKQGHEHAVQEHVRNRRKKYHVVRMLQSLKSTEQ